MNKEITESKSLPFADYEVFSTALEEQAWMYETEFSPDYMIE